MTRKVGNGKKIKTSFGTLELAVVVGIWVKSKLKVKSPNSFTTNGVIVGTLHKLLMFLFGVTGTKVGVAGKDGELRIVVVNGVFKILVPDVIGKFIVTV